MVNQETALAGPGMSISTSSTARRRSSAELISWEPPTPAVLNRSLPGFEVIRLLGRGGMGAVYLAKQQSLDRFVAIKILPHRESGGKSEFVERFRREARTLAHLAHPSIVAVHDFGVTEAGWLFIVMEYLDGLDLAQRLEGEGRLPIHESLRIALAICDALRYAQSKGVVHRDIKPANILMASDGSIKVADFGLAKIAAPAGSHNLTLSNTSMGTHDYAAPEVFGGADTSDHRADLYSLGVVLYQMLTGDVPRGLFKLPSEKIPGLDARLDAVVCRAMEEDREDRYASAAEMRQDLESLKQEQTPVLFEPGSDIAVTSRNIPAPWSPRIEKRLSWLRVAMAIAAMGIASVALLFILRSDIRPLATSGVETGWRDVLTQIDLARDQRAGYWKLTGGVLCNQYETGYDAIAFPVHTSEPYDLQIKLTRLTPGVGGLLAIPFRFQGHDSQWVISEYVRPYARIGEFKGAEDDVEAASKVNSPTMILPLNVPRELLLQVREDGVAASIDGKEWLRHQGDWNKLASQDGGVWLTEKSGGEPITGLYIHSGLVEIHSVEFRAGHGLAERKLTPPSNFGHPPEHEEIAATFGGNGHRYALVPGQFTWSEALADARSRGGHLATLSDQAEHDWVWRTFSAHLPVHAERNFKSRGWWLGGTESASGSYWLWVTGEPFSFSHWAEGEPNTSSKPPRSIWQHDNAIGSIQSSWRALSLSTKNTGPYLLEWDSPSPFEDSAVTEASARQFAAWLFELPPSTEPGHADHRVPDLIVSHGSRNIFRLRDLPPGPLEFTRIRIGPLTVDEAARRQLRVMGHMRSLWDLRIYAATDASALEYLGDLSRLGTFVFIAAKSDVRPPLPDDLLAHLEKWSQLGTLRLEGWSDFSGRGLGHLSCQKRLETLSVSDCPGFSDTGLAEVSRFTSMKGLNLAGTSVTESAVAELRRSLPNCSITLPDGRVAQ